jgi:hypothetical protein
MTAQAAWAMRRMNRPTTQQKKNCIAPSVHTLTFGARSAANPKNSIPCSPMICFLYKHTMSLIWIFVKIFPQFTYSAETCESFLPLLFELTDVAIEAPAGSPAVDLAVGLQKICNPC